MKKLLSLIIALCFLNTPSWAAVSVSEAPIISVGTPTSITVSSHTIVIVPSTNTAQLTGRAGFYLVNPSTGATAVSGYIGDCTTVSAAITIEAITISTTPGSNFLFFPLRDDNCLHLHALKSPYNWGLFYQEVIRR